MIQQRLRRAGFLIEDEAASASELSWIQTIRCPMDIPAKVHLAKPALASISRSGTMVTICPKKERAHGGETRAISYEALEGPESPP